MNIFVAAGTFLLESLKDKILHFKSLTLLNMAILTLKLSVLASERIFGHRMIKMFNLPLFLGVTLRTIPIAKPGPKLPSMLIFVTGETLVLFQTRPMILNRLPLRRMAL
jgi:hypothetical protein